ncbi:temperature dependent protein affecting M2 dsRNA replication-domain-containing protein [Spinellus fusiger]|nr:temperature dependent protein affecting M2 dsRNA replication-domain-containing protein [Spinellus fusiger]
MPIRHFDIFTAERRLIQTSAISQLKDTRIGIDGSYWLRKILAKESAIAALGGVPLNLKHSIERELKLFKAHQIQPFFVFSGLSILRKDKPFSSEDSRPSHRATGWELLDKGKTDLALTHWSNSGGIHPADFLNQVFHILRQHGVEFIRAPYSAWAQLAYLYTHPRQLISAVYGGSELLMFSIDKIISGIDYEKLSYSWISKKTILQDLHVSEEQFLDICILAGFEYCPSFPPFNTNVISFSFKGIHELIQQHKTGLNAIQFYSHDPCVAKTNYIDAFFRARCAIKFHLVMTDEGQVRPLNIEQAPNDIHEFIGYRLPDELYYYLMCCLVGPQSINTLVSGVLIENPPLDNGETVEYRRFLIPLLELRTQTLSLLTQPLHQYYQGRKVVSYFWFEPGVEHIMHHNDSAPANNNKSNAPHTIYQKTIAWYVSKEAVKSEKAAQHTHTVDIAFCIRATLTEAKVAKLKSNNRKPLEGKDEILANVLWKMLQIRDFVSSRHAPTVWGSALSAGLSAITKGNEPVSSEVQEALLTALDLIRSDVLTNKPFSKNYSSIGGDEKEQLHIRLITRTLSLLPMNLKSTPWSGPFNRDLLVFNSFVKALNRSYRNLCEMLTLSLFLNNAASKERTDYFEITDG